MSQGEGGGRPTKYKSAYIKQAKALSKLGATEFEIAQFLGVADSTLRLWMVQHPKFSAAIKLGKGPPNRRMEMSLYARGRGYSFEAEEIFLIDEVIETPQEDPKLPPIITRTKKVLRVPVVKHVPPDTGAAAFYLKNREKLKWRDKHDYELSGKNGKPIGIAVAGEPELLGAYYDRLKRIAADRADPAPHQNVDRDGQGGEGSEGGEEPGPS